MNIAIFTDAYPPLINGVSTSTSHLAEIFRKNGHRVIVIAPSYKRGKVEIIGDDIRLPGIILKGLYGLSITKIYDRKVMKILKESNIDVVHYHSDASTGIFARRVVKKLNIPLVYTYHTFYEDYTHYFSKGLRPLDKIMKIALRDYTYLTSKKISMIVVPSQKSKEYLENAGVEQEISVVPTGINIDKYHVYLKTEKFFKELRKKYSLKKSTKVALVLSRLGKEKSIDVTIKYFASYFRKHTNEDIRLMIVGQGPDRAYFEEICRTEGIKNKVIFVGSVPHSDVNNYYLFADAFISSSLTETQGLTLIEAMSARTITLVRKDPTNESLIIDGESGFAFENEEEFILKLYKAFHITKEEKEKLDSGMRKALSPYSLQTFYEKILEVYQHAISKYDHQD